MWADWPSPFFACRQLRAKRFTSSSNLFIASGRSQFTESDYGVGNVTPIDCSVADSRIQANVCEQRGVAILSVDVFTVLLLATHRPDGAFSGSSCFPMLSSLLTTPVPACAYIRQRPPSLSAVSVLHGSSMPLRLSCAWPPSACPNRTSTKKHPSPLPATPHSVAVSILRSLWFSL